ncbi:MAG: type II secretion system ATPase GspE [Nitrospinae bacterium]|nr:type II secretion system ATPase GspE [Nitrospinota bacterium]
METLERTLIREKKITEEQLQKVAAQGNSKSIGKRLVEMGYIAEEDMLNIMGRLLNLSYLKLSELEKSSTFSIANIPRLDDRISVKFMKEYKIFPLKIDNNTLTLVMADPLDVSTMDEVRLTTGYDIQVCLSGENEILDAIEKQYGTGATTMERIIGDMSEEEIDLMGGEAEEETEHLKDLASEAPVIKLVNLIITRAVEISASDIHIEPFEGDLKIRYRIDGVLHDVESPPKKLQSAVISRIKIMSKLNIAERRLPQDGRIRFKAMGKNIDMRVSSLPTIYGESIVMRILDRGGVVLELEKLGFPSKELSQFENLISKPYGMLLVTGPTGSGKTTTLYTGLHKINSPDIKVITIEDPVEYQMHGINQIHVKPQIGLTFASGLRSIVRQDPDVIMVGEIRDPETADIAIQSALTGHMVFSTVHTNDAAGAITRLQDMGVESFLMSSALLGVLAQRLVRVICKKCKTPSKMESKMIDEMGIKEGLGSFTIYEGKGCDECSNTGYRGRVVMTSANIIKEKAREQGMKTLREDGWDKVKQGVTSISEVLRVTLEEEL